MLKIGDKFVIIDNKGYYTDEYIENVEYTVSDIYEDGEIIFNTEKGEHHIFPEDNIIVEKISEKPANPKIELIRKSEYFLKIGEVEVKLRKFEIADLRNKLTEVLENDILD